MTRLRRARPLCSFRLLALAFAVTAALVRRATGARPAGPDADARARAPAPAAKPWYEEIAVNGFVSASYSYNFNRPDSGTNQFRVFDFDDNTFKVDVAEIVLQKAVGKPGEAGFRVDAVGRLARSRASRPSFGLLAGRRTSTSSRPS